MKIKDDKKNITEMMMLRLTRCKARVILRDEHIKGLEDGPDEDIMMMEGQTEEYPEEPSNLRDFLLKNQKQR